MKATKHGLAVVHRGMVNTGHGNCHLESQYEEATGAVIRALNEHDDLIKERYALILQRDALVAACRLFTWAYYGNGGTDVNWELYDRAGIAALAALALVKGEQKSDNATA